MTVRRSDLITIGDDVAVAGRLPTPALPRGVDPLLIRRIQSSRHARLRFFDPDLVADPVWDMLLDLGLAAMEGREISVSSLCIASNVPRTTALRWIVTMVERGLVTREADPADGRRSIVRLTDEAADALHKCLAFIAKQWGRD